MHRSFCCLVIAAATDHSVRYTKQVLKRQMRSGFGGREGETRV